MDGSISTTQHESANDLLRALESMRMDQPQPGMADYDWFFRGQRLASWKLEPSAIRQARALAISSAQGQAAYERYALGAFFTYCDRVGLLVPWDGPALRAEISKDIGPAGWEAGVPRDLVPLAALAQHNGVPTRLLDWTRDPLAAAYFACCDPEGPAVSGDLAVWAMRIRTLHSEGSPVPLESDGASVRIVSAPRATNTNLHAQSGIFTMVEHSATTGARPVASPLNIDDIAAAISDSEVPHVRKLVLPESALKSLRRELRRRGVDRLRLFPGYDTAAGAAREAIHNTHLAQIADEVSRQQPPAK